MSAPGVHANASPLKRALVAIEKLQARVEELEGARREPIAIVGLSCRFPGGADSPEAFWRLLQEGVDAVAEIPPDRWDADAYYDPDPDAAGKMATRWGAFLPRVDTFDPRLFGITPREAAGMDPQQRLLLELSWEALERAGIAPDRLAGTPTGVFVGIVNDDYRLMALERGVLDELGAYFASGTAHSVAAGRIAYVLGFQGPAIAVDTACSSSLVAVHLAVQSLRAGECRMALAGGANVVLSPEMTIALSKYRMMAADGRCKAFDARADGFVRGEGGAVLVLKRLSDAQAAGDRILAVIRGSAVNQDGPSSGLTAPNGPAQEAVLRAALADGGVAPDAVGYVEAHGTGTSLGDPIEVQALDAVLGRGRDPDRPLLIGSVKTNIGHLEGAAGVAGLVKAVLVLQHGEIPASLHFREPNPLIAWERMRVRVAAQRTVWERGEGGSRIAGVSSFGFSGTNAHVVVEEWRGSEEAERSEPSVERPVELAVSGAGTPVRLERTGHEQPAEMHVSGATRPVALQASGVDRPVQVLTLSARDEAALGELPSRYAAHLEAHAEQRFQDVAHTANVGRAHLPHRLAVLASSAAEAAERLAAHAAGATAPGITTGRAPHDDPPEVVFLFTGQGSQYAGMGRELYESSPVFRSALDRCAAVLESELEVPLLEVLYPEPGGRGEGLLERTEYTQPALFALEWSLVELWRSWGVEPALVLGHSVGEYVAACVAGVLEVEEALRLVAVRGRLMGSLPGGGVMVAVFAPEERVREVVERVGGGEVSVAAVNAPESVVVSGAEEAVERVVGELVSGGVGVQRLRVSHAFHSALMDPVVGEFERVASGVRYGEARIGVVSNVTGEVVGSEVLGQASYWARQLREAVRYADGVKALWARGQRVFVEVG
ncbi:MAG TPA: type I polyketide synthase, partial [Gemmatimonadales bacterium]|nr:type I polyketide synthase [Gemmatimonadales bacterium]